jgi:hypothetical protein
MFKMKKIYFLFYLIIFIVFVLLLSWLIKSAQAERDKNLVENFNDYYKGLLIGCGAQNQATYNCCLNSVKYMATSGYKLAAETSCNPGFKINTLLCLGSYKWCEMIR